MPPWTDAQIRTRAGLIVRSYRHWSGENLVDLPSDDPTEQANALFDAPVAVLAHDTQADPLCVYMNAAALSAFELTIAQAAEFRTRQTAAPEDRQERSAALAGAEEVGLVTGYSGVRVSSSGRRFRINEGRIWTVLDDDGQPVGQAATFVPGPV